MRLHSHHALIAILLMTAACTQDPAKIDFKGQTIYGYNGPSIPYASNVSNSAGAYTPHSYTPETTQQASLSSVSSNDLAPLTKATPAPAQVASSKPPQGAINPWTRKQRVTETDTAALDEDNEPAPAAPAKADHSSFMWPVASHKILSTYGPKGGGKVNDGINIASNEGEPVWASADGEAVYVGNELQGYGTIVLLKHSGGKTTTYAHLSRATIDKYDHVKQGDIIGYVGATGNVKSPQLHFAIRDAKGPIDPELYLTNKVAEN